MKFSGNRQLILNSLFFISAAVFLSIGLYLGIKFIPNAVSYTVSTSENGNVKEDISEISPDDGLYDNIFLITENGPYRIGAENGEIFVSSGEKRLYRIKAHLSQFPSSDKNAVLSGITVDDKASLYEMVQYMES